MALLPERRGRRAWSIGITALVAISGSAWWLGARAQSPEQAAARASEPNASWITVEVEKRVLASTIVMRGDVIPEVSLSIGVPSSVEGAGVVTRLPPAVGSEVAEGSVVIEVSGRPVFVLEGDLPVYRSLKPGMSGADVLQLQRALSRLGFAADTDGVYGETTKSAVIAFYEAAGYEPLQSSTSPADVSTAEQAFHDADSALVAAEAALATAKAGDSSSSVVAAQAALNRAKRSLTDAEASRNESVSNAQVALTNAQNAYNTAVNDPLASQADKDAAYANLIQAQTGLSAAERHGDDAIADAADSVLVAKIQLGEAKKAIDVNAAQALRDSAAASRDAASLAYMQIAASTGPVVAQGEVVFLPTMPAMVQSAIAALGPIGAIGADPSQTTDPSNLVRLAAGEFVVTTSIRENDEGLIRIGMAVELLDETTNSVYAATLVAIADVATIDAVGQFGRAATIAAEDPLPSNLSGVNLRVTITSAASVGEVLVVPLAAVSSAADGRTRVSILRGQAIAEVSVNVGISADGFVAVTPINQGELKPGDLVVVGR